MSIQTNEKISANDIQNLYTQINNVINTAASGVIDPPTFTNGKIEDDNVLTLVNTLNSFETDEYLSTATQQGMYSTFDNAKSEGVYSGDLWYTVKQGKLISPLAISPITTTLQDLNDSTTGVKCRNKATNNYGALTNGAKSNGSNGYGTQYAGTCSRGGSRYGNGSNQNGTYSVACSSGTQSNNYNSNTSVIDIFCALATKTNN